VETMHNKWFIVMVALSVIANAAIIALTDFSDVDVHGNLLYNSPRNKLLLESDPVFAAVFSFEMVVKMIAMGVYDVGGGAYFNDGWNTLDFIVCMSW